LCGIIYKYGRLDGVRLMAGSSDALRGVRFQTATAKKPEERGCRKWCKPWTWFRRGARNKEEPEPVFEAQAIPAEKPAAPAPRQETAPAPFIIAEPENPAIVSFMESLPNGGIREYAKAAVRKACGDRVPTLEEAKKALVCDAGNGEMMQNRRASLFALAFPGRQNEMMKPGALENSETINVFYYRNDLFEKMMTLLIGHGEDGRVRAKSEDRMAMLQAMEKLLLAMPHAERIDAFVLMVEIAIKMKKTLGTKEICIRLKGIFGIMAGEEGDKPTMLREMHEKVMKCGVRPSGADMNSGVPRADREEASRWIAGRPQGSVMNAAALLWARNKPQSYSEFMRMLEEDASDTENRRLHVLEEAVGEWTGRECCEYQPSKIAERCVLSWNVGYFCIMDIKEVTDLAKGMKNEEEVRLDVLHKILWIARRMPPGRRTEAPGLVASAVRKLVAGDEELGLKPQHREWVVTDWLNELLAHINERDSEIMYKRLGWVPLYPMKVVNYMAGQVQKQG